MHNWDTPKSLILKFAGFHLSRILYKCLVFTLEENDKISARITPESPPPEEKFSDGMIRVIPLESFGDGARDPQKIARKKLPLFEGLLPDGL